MIEILPIRLLAEEDKGIFGNLNVNLGKLLRLGLPVANGIVITPPQFKLKTVLEHYDFGVKEVFEQSLTLVKKEIQSYSVPQALVQETGKQKQFYFNGRKIKSVKSLWLVLLEFWLDQIKERLWNSGFYQGITEGLDPKFVVFGREIKGFGVAYIDQFSSDVKIFNKLGKLHPMDVKKIAEVVYSSNKKLLIPHEYEWILDKGVKIAGLKLYTPSLVQAYSSPAVVPPLPQKENAEASISAVKVFFDLSAGFTIEKNVDGVYISAEKVFDLNRPKESIEDLIFKTVESAITFPNSPILFKLADKSEGMGKVRGALRLLHQKSLFDPLAAALDFARHKKGLTNIHVVIPFVRGVNELLQMKRDLAVKKLSRKNSLQLWMELSVPENIVNLEDYLIAGVDGVVLNLNELAAYFNGFDPMEENLSFYKSEVLGLIKFLELGIKLLHKSKIPFLAYGNLVLDSKILEFLVEKGVYGIVTERYEAHSAHDLLNQIERKLVIRKSM